MTESINSIREALRVEWPDVQYVGIKQPNQAPASNNVPAATWAVPMTSEESEFVEEWNESAHSHRTPDFLWENLTFCVPYLDDENHVLSYTAFEDWAIQISHELFPATDPDDDVCSNCDCLRMIWLRFQLTAALDVLWVAMQKEINQTGGFARYRLLRAAIRYELEIARD